MRACSVSEQNSHIPLDRRTFLQWLSQWWRGQHEFRVSEFQYYSEKDETRVRIAGPQVLLEPDAAQAIAVTLHELATNAAN